VYCHNPARWLYQQEDFLLGLPKYAGLGLRALRRPLVKWDHRAARSATRYLANSTSVAGRIGSTYGINADVLHPPAGVDPYGPRDQIAGIAPGFLLAVGRGRGYKNLQPVLDAMKSMPEEHLVAVGMDEAGTTPNVTPLRGISDAQMRWLYSQADCLIAVSREDFGLTPIEAYAFGTPAITLRAGGYLDTTIENVTGLFVERPDPAAICEAVVQLRGREWDNGAIEAHGHRFAEARFQTQLRSIVTSAIQKTSSKVI